VAHRCKSGARLVLSLRLMEGREMYVYVMNRDEPNGSSAKYTVGFYDPTGKWHPESDYATTEEAAHRVSWLNGNSKE
jgi:hypothetical protein